MIRIPAAALGALLALPLCAAAGSPAAQARRSAVPLVVRVFEGGRFVADLGIKDFAVSENGSPRPVEALYRIARNSILRREGDRDFLPFTGRRFYLLFQLFEYHPKIAEAVRALFDAGLLPGDTLEIQTPGRNYKLSALALDARPKKALADEMIDLIRRDISQGSMAYNSLMRELKSHVRAIGGASAGGSLESSADTDGLSIEMLLPRYREIVQKLDALRRIDARQIIRFAQEVKSQPGEKWAFYFYQREFRPELSPQALDDLIGGNQEKIGVLGDAQEIFQTYQQNFALEAPEMKEAFADAAVTFNLLYLNKDPERVARIVMREQSADIFRALAEIAAATGGLVDTSQNPAAAFRNALRAADDYYLLYYAPGDKAPAGAFLPLSVKVPNAGWRVVHRSGLLGR